jgi:hypothetical protein
LLELLIFAQWCEYALYPIMIEVISTWDLENILFHKWNISKLGCEGDNEQQQTNMKPIALL